MSFFSASNLSVNYGKNNILHDISFSLPSGNVLGILGANGCGKTTLMKAICGILPHHGSCTLEGQSLEALSPRQIARLCSYIPQRSGISIDISTLDVVLMGFNPKLGLLEHPNAAMQATARDALAQVGLSDKEDMNYLHLSEGQKQLCMLARTLVSDCRLMLLDEPESALDFHFRHRMLEIIRHWTIGSSGSAIVTLHDPYLALNCCDQLLLLSEGRITGSIHPQSDSLAKMEQLLSTIYGNVSLQCCISRSGEHNLVMLKEQEP